METSDFSACLAYNGEIYNYLELKKELQKIVLFLIWIRHRGIALFTEALGTVGFEQTKWDVRIFLF